MPSPLDADGALIDRHVMVWRYRADLWVSAFWGSPDEREVARVVAAYDVALDEGRRFRALIDFSRIEHIDPLGFERMAGWAQAARERLDARVIWQAIVLPPGVLGATVAGFHKSLGYQLDSHFFPSLDEAASARFAPDEGEAIRREVVARIAALVSPDPLVELRRALRERPRATLDEIARALAVSRRTLQRQLTLGGTTFRDERLRERIALAKERLGDPAAKIESIARDLGFLSRQHFTRQFSRAVGVSPSEFRGALAARP